MQSIILAVLLMGQVYTWPSSKIVWPDGAEGPNWNNVYYEGFNLPNPPGDPTCPGSNDTPTVDCDCLAGPCPITGAESMTVDASGRWDDRNNFDFAAGTEPLFVIDFQLNATGVAQNGSFFIFNVSATTGNRLLHTGSRIFEIECEGGANIGGSAILGDTEYNVRAVWDFTPSGVGSTVATLYADLTSSGNWGVTVVDTDTGCNDVIAADLNTIEPRSFSTTLTVYDEVGICDQTGIGIPASGRCQP